VGTYSNAFYANVGDSNGPAKIVMAEGTPTRCSNCRFYSSPFTVTEYAACGAVTKTGCTTAPCPFALNSSLLCSWSGSGTVLVDVPNVVNGAAPVSSPVLVNGTLTSTPLADASKPIFTYNTLDPYSFDYVPGDGGTPSATTGILPGFNTCAAPTMVSGSPTDSNCSPDDIQSIDFDLEVQVQGSPIQETAFTIYRLSSSSYMYSPVVG
jgi:hypothetical protein